MLKTVGLVSDVSGGAALVGSSRAAPGSGISFTEAKQTVTDLMG